MKIKHTVLQIFAMYIISIGVAYGLYWVGGGEGRSPELAILILMAMLTTTGIIPK